MQKSEALKILGLKSGAPPREVKLAFRKLARTTHPDLCKGDTQAAAKFALILEAYVLLKNDTDWRATGSLQISVQACLPVFDRDGRGNPGDSAGSDPAGLKNDDTDYGSRGPLAIIFVRAFLAEHDIAIRFDDRYVVRSAVRMAVEADEIETYLRSEPISPQTIVDDLMLELSAKGMKLRKSEVERALRKVTREARKERKVILAMPLLAPMLAGEQSQAESGWSRLAEAAFKGEPHLNIAILKHFIWQVKGKLRGLPLKHHLMPVIWSSDQGSGKTTFVTRFVAPLEELAAGPVLLSDVADRRSSDIYRYPVLFVDDVEAIPPSLVPVLKSLVTSGSMQRRRLGTSLSVAITQAATLIGTANSGIEMLVKDETGHRRFAMLEFRNGEVAKGGDARVWNVIDSIDYALLWRSVDPMAPAPIIPCLGILFRQQEQSRGRDQLKAWLMSLDLESESVKNISNRHGVKAKALYELFVLDTDDTMTLARFGTAMVSYTNDPDTPFRAKIYTTSGVVYPFKANSREK